MSFMKKPDDAIIELIKLSGSDDQAVALPAQRKLAKALTLPLRQGVLVGDIATMIFESMVMPPGSSLEFPLDLLAPGEEDEFVAYTMPNTGRIPERNVEGDYVMVPTYRIANAIDWSLQYAEDARWDIVGRAMQVLRAGFTKKLNDDGFHLLISAAADRNILVFDGDATAGQFTKRLVSLGKTVMRRNGGGNSASLKRGRLTDLYMSPEGFEDIRNWGLDQIDEVTRREIFNAGDNGLTRIFQVNLHDLDEFGVGQEYQLFLTSTLGGSLATSDVEFALGLDLSANDSFLMPIKKELRLYEDPTLHRQGRAGWYGDMFFGLATLDNRRVLALSY